MAKTNQQLKDRIAAKNAPAVGGVPSVANQVHDALQKMMPQIQAALPKHITPERMARVALTSIRTTPKLMQCSLESLLAAVMQSAQLGLEPGILGHAYFVPFGNQVQFIAGYKGLLSLARRSGNIQSIAANVVCENDEFTYSYGFEEDLRHVPKFRNRGEIVAAYAYAVTKDGGRYFEVMSREEVDAIRKRSKAATSGPWVSDYAQMARKTVLRRLCNYLDLQVEHAEAITAAVDQEFIDLAPGQELNLGTLPEPEPVQSVIAEVAPDSTTDQDSRLVLGLKEYGGYTVTSPNTPYSGMTLADVAESEGVDGLKSILIDAEAYAHENDVVMVRRILG